MIMYWAQLRRALVAPETSLNKSGLSGERSIRSAVDASLEGFGCHNRRACRSDVSRMRGAIVVNSYCFKMRCLCVLSLSFLCIGVPNSQANRQDSVTAAQSNAKTTANSEPDFQGRPASVEDLALRITPTKSVVIVGQTLGLRVEFWNDGNTPLFICKDFLAQAAVGCGLTFSFTPHGTGPRSLSAGDCFLGGQKFNFAKELMQHWVLLPPKTFYGAGVVLYRDSNNHELEEPGSYRLSGEYSSGGLLSGANCNAISLFPDEVASLPGKSWTGRLNSNSVAIRVIAKK
jgi:hypothetical protein